MLECCARVPAEGKAAVLGRSGSLGVFAADLANAGPKPHLEWISCGETVGPAYLRLATKLLKGRALLPFDVAEGLLLEFVYLAMLLQTESVLGVPDMYPEAGLLMRWQLRFRMWASLSMT